MHGTISRTTGTLETILSLSLSHPAKQVAEDELGTKCIMTCGAFLYQPPVPAFFLTGEILSESGINFFKFKNEVISEGFNSQN
jgi:hypothetical protein